MCSATSADRLGFGTGSYGTMIPTRDSALVHRQPLPRIQTCLPTRTKRPFESAEFPAVSGDGRERGVAISIPVIGEMQQTKQVLTHVPGHGINDAPDMEKRLIDVVHIFE
jgi:hypothetical protein